MPLVTVEDLDDNRLADYRHLQEPNVGVRGERDAGICTVEGWLSLEALAEPPYPVRSAPVATEHVARRPVDQGQGHTPAVGAWIAVGSGRPTDMTVFPAPPSAPSLRIASRRSGIDRVWGSVFAVAVAVIGAGVVALAFVAPSDDGALLVIFAPVAPFFLFMLWTIGRTWRQLRSISTPLELDTHGLTLQSPQGTVRCPWGAVTSIGSGRIGLLGTRVIVIRLHPQAGPGVPGIESTVPPRSWRIIHRHGLRYAAWLLDIEDDQLAAAIAELSAGRVRFLPSG